MLGQSTIWIIGDANIEVVIFLAFKDINEIFHFGFVRACLPAGRSASSATAARKRD